MGYYSLSKLVFPTHQVLTVLLALHNGSSALDINRFNGEKVELKGKKLSLAAIMGKGMRRL